MKTKIVDKFIYEELGFPIELQEVEMYNIHGEWHPKIDVEKIANSAIKDLVSPTRRLTGNQIKFIRNYFSMSLREFAEKIVHESHTAVNKWEKNGNKATRMDINIEKMLKLYAYEQVFVKTVQQKRKFFDYYLEFRDTNPKDINIYPVQISCA